MDEVLTIIKKVVKQNEDMKEEIKMLRKNVNNKIISTGNFPESSSKLPLFPLTTLEDVDELEELLEDAEQRRIQVL